MNEKYKTTIDFDNIEIPSRGIEEYIQGKYYALYFVNNNAEIYTPTMRRSLYVKSFKSPQKKQ